MGFIVSASLARRVARKEKRAGQGPARGSCTPASRRVEGYFRCLDTSLVISNIETWRLPPKTSRSLSSASIIRRLTLFWRLFFLMYPHSLLVTSVRGIGLLPTTAASVELGVIGFMKAAFGLRFAAGFFALAARLLAAAFFIGFFAAGFFAAGFFSAFFVFFSARVDYSQL